MNAPNPLPAPPEAKPQMGIMALIGLLVGVGCVLFSLLGVINTAFDLDLVLRVSGARVDVPSSYDSSLGLAVAGLLIVGLTLFASFVARRFEKAKGKPLVRVAIVLVALLILAVLGRGLQILALTSTYGSMLAYYCTDGDLEDVRAELAKGPSHEDLDRSVHRAAQYDNAAALELLLEAGADFQDQTNEPQYRHCALGSTGPEFVAVALRHGVTPATCPDSEALIWRAANSDLSDEDTAEVVRQLAGAGWSVHAMPEHSDQSPLSRAERQGKPLTTAALRELGAASP